MHETATANARILAAAMLTALAVSVLGAAPVYRHATVDELTPASRPRTTQQGVARFAADRFFAGAYLDLDGVLNSRGYWNFPFDTLISSPILFDRYRSSNITEIAVFLAADSMEGNAPDEGFELAAAVRLKRSLVPTEVLSTIANIVSPSPSEMELPIELISIGDRECYRVPSGTFLNSRNKSGTLHFEAEDGSIKPQGVNVGDMAPLEYVQGGSKEAAVFTFDGVAASDLIANKLRLGLALSVFRIRMLEDEFSQAQIFLRQPGGGLASDPITFDAKAFVDMAFEFPRELRGTDADGVVSNIDLKDLMAGGRLEVVIKGLNEAAYLGFDQHSLHLKTDSAEFLAFDGRDVVIAQSQQTLSMMLKQQAESSLAKRLGREGHEIVLSAEVENRRQREALGRFLNTISMDSVASYVPNQGSLDGTADVEESVVGQVVMKHENPSRARILSGKLRQELSAGRKSAKRASIESIARLDAMDQLRSRVLPDIPQRTPVPNINFEEFERHLENCLDRFFDGINIDAIDDSMSIKFELSRPLKQESRLDQLVMASLELVRAIELCQFNQFYMGDRIHRRVTDRLVHEASAWCRRAHQLTFNTSVEFDGFQSRYDWVRRGIETLIDGAEQNPETTDLLWMTAKFIVIKMGTSDERRQFQSLLSIDRELHRRLSKWIDLSAARSDDGALESWLVAKMLFQYCIDQQVASGKKSSLPPFLFFSRPARAQAGFAASLDERGQVEHAATQWAEAKKLYDALSGNPDILSGSINANPFQSPGSLSVNKEITRESIFQRWVWRAEFEQTQVARALRKLAFDARTLADKKQLDASCKQYLSAMQTISDLVLNQPDQSDQIFEAVSDIVIGYQNVVRQLGIATHDSCRPTIEAFKEFKSKHFDVLWL